MKPQVCLLLTGQKTFIGCQIKTISKVSHLWEYNFWNKILHLICLNELCIFAEFLGNFNQKFLNRLF
jgi:hypothetical protein